MRETMGADPFSGAVYVFRAKRAQLSTFCMVSALRRLPIAGIRCLGARCRLRHFVVGRP